MSDTLTVHFHPEEHADQSWPDPRQDRYAKTYLGFWIYLLTDCALFASFFITYAVLNRHTFGGAGPADLFVLWLPFVQTLLLLISSMTSGWVMLAACRDDLKQVLFALFATALLGISFLSFEGYEFAHLLAEGHSWKNSAFLSSFFSLVGMHGVHIVGGLVWLAVLVGQVATFGITASVFRRLAMFTLFWHFLDLIWVFIFTFVYLMGVL